MAVTKKTEVADSLAHLISASESFPPSVTFRANLNLNLNLNLEQHDCQDTDRQSGLSCGRLQ